MKINLNSQNLNCTIKGHPSGLPVIFIHGFPFNMNMWHPQLKTIPEKFFTIAYDVRGHGDSDYGDGQYLIEFFVDDLIDLMNYFKIQKSVLVGLSMGGYIALRTIERNPERISALVLCSTKSAADTNEAKIRRAHQIRLVKSEGISKFTEEFLKLIFHEDTFTRSPSMINLIRDVIHKTSILTVASTLIALSARTDTTDALQNIKVPTLIMVGEHDKLTTPDDAIKMQNLIPKSELHIIPGAAHMINLENTTLFNKYLFDFLNRIDKLKEYSYAN